MAEKYTRESLQGESRVSLRQIAMKELGLTARQISEMKSEQIISAILEKQAKEDGQTDQPEPPTPVAQPAQPAKATKPKPDTKAAAPANGGPDLTVRIDAVGKAVDEMEEKLSDGLKSVEKQLYILFGLICDLWTVQYGSKDEFEERVHELEQEYTGLGN